MRKMIGAMSSTMMKTITRLLRIKTMERMMLVIQVKYQIPVAVREQVVMEQAMAPDLVLLKMKRQLKKLPKTKPERRAVKPFGKFSRQLLRKKSR